MRCTKQFHMKINNIKFHRDLNSRAGAALGRWIRSHYIKKQEKSFSDSSKNFNEIVSRNIRHTSNRRHKNAKISMFHCFLSSVVFQFAISNCWTIFQEISAKKKRNKKYEKLVSVNANENDTRKMEISSVRRERKKISIHELKWDWGIYVKNC